MSTLPTPAIFRNLHGKVDPGVVSAIHLIFNATKDAHDAIVALSGQHGTTVQNVSNVTTQIGSLTTIINNVAEAVPEGNVNQQTVPYAIQNSDYGGVVILQGAGPYDITLNSAVTMPYYTICFNLGSVSATVTPDLAGATINNVASLTLGVNQWMLIFFDGLNWWGLTFTIPVSIVKVAHQWLDSYDSTTGLFTQSQPAAADLSDGTTGTGAVVLASALSVYALSSALPLTGVSGSLGGAALTAGQTITINVTVTGATTSMVAATSPQTYPGDGFCWDAYVSAADTVTVRLTCVLSGTPVSSVYSVRVVQ